MAKENMKKFLLITLLCIPTICNSSTIKEQQENDSKITFEELDSETIPFATLNHIVIIKGHCVLNHNLTLEDNGILIIAHNAQLEIQSKEKYISKVTGPNFFVDQKTGLVVYYDTPDLPNAVTLSGLKNNNLVFENATSTIVIQNAIIFNFLENYTFNTGTINIAQESLLHFDAPTHWWQIFTSKKTLTFSPQFSIILQPKAIIQYDGDIVRLVCV
jgi:hypothetical protein